MMRRLPIATLAAVLLAAAPAHALTDQEFLSRAMEINIADISAGLLAQQKAEAPSVREYGSRMVIDHIANGAAVIALSQSLGVSPPTQPSAGDLAVFRQLMDFDGARFDAAFANRMVTAHQEAITLFEEKAAEGDGEVTAYALETLATLQGHLQLAEGLLADDGSGAPAAGAAAQHELHRPMAEADASVYPGTGMADTGLDPAPTDARQVSAYNLVGVTLYGAGSEAIGEISDVILSPAASGNGRVAIDAVLVDVGGFLGIGAKSVAIGYEAMEVRRDGNGNLQATTRLAREQFEAAEEYDANAFRERRDSVRLGAQR